MPEKLLLFWSLNIYKKKKLQRHYVLISKPHKPALFYDFKTERKIPEDTKLIIIVLKLNLKHVGKKLCTNITPI